MKIAAVFVIAAFANGNLQTEATYPMSSVLECEAVASHQAVLDSYPGRVLFCWDVAAPMPPGWIFPDSAFVRENASSGAPAPE